MKTLMGLFLVIIISASINTSTLAQTEQKTEKENLQSFSFYFINGYALAYDYYKTDAFRLRANLSLDLSGSDIESDGENKYVYTNPSLYGSKEIRDEDTKSDYLGVALSTHMIYPIYNTQLGNIYVGFGPSIGYSKRNSNSTYKNERYSPDTVSVPTVYFNSSEYIDSDFYLAASLLFGLEAYIVDNISLFAETHLSAGIDWTENKTTHKYSSGTSYDETSEYNSEGSGWFYSFQYVRMGVKISI